MDSAFSLEQLRQLSAPPADGLPYCRPFLSKRPATRHSIALVGINPATPIYPSEVDLDDYVALLQDFERFSELYRRRRVAVGKRELSRTRVGIEALVAWLADEAGDSVVEMNANACTTANVRDLDALPSDVRRRGEQVFVDVVTRLQPRVMVLHGKGAAQRAFEALRRHSDVQVPPFDPDERTEAVERRGTWFRFEWPGGPPCVVFGCRHLMYYGRQGESFTAFRHQVAHALAGGRRSEL